MSFLKQSSETDIGSHEIHLFRDRRQLVSNGYLDPGIGGSVPKRLGFGEGVSGLTPDLVKRRPYTDEVLTGFFCLDGHLGQSEKSRRLASC